MTRSACNEAGRDSRELFFFNINRREWASSLIDKGRGKKNARLTRNYYQGWRKREYVMRVLDGGRASMAALVHCKLDGVPSLFLPLPPLSCPFVGLSNLSFGIKDTVQTSGISENFTETNRAGHKFRTASGIVISFPNDLARDHFSVERITLSNRNRFPCANTA